MYYLYVNARSPSSRELLKLPRLNFKASAGISILCTNISSSNKRVFIMMYFRWKYAERNTSEIVPTSRKYQKTTLGTHRDDGRWKIYDYVFLGHFDLSGVWWSTREVIITFSLRSDKKRARWRMNNVSTSRARLPKGSWNRKRVAK